MAHSTPKKGSNGTLTPFTPDAGGRQEGQEGQGGPEGQGRAAVRGPPPSS